MFSKESRSLKIFSSRLHFTCWRWVLLGSLLKHFFHCSLASLPTKVNFSHIQVHRETRHAELGLHATMILHLVFVRIRVGQGHRVLFNWEAAESGESVVQWWWCNLNCKVLCHFSHGMRYLLYRMLSSHNTQLRNNEQRFHIPDLCCCAGSHTSARRVRLMAMQMLRAGCCFLPRVPLFRNKVYRNHDTRKQKCAELRYFMRCETLSMRLYKKIGLAHYL